MLLQPKKFKFKKIHKNRLKKFKFNDKLRHGTIGLKSLESGSINARQIEAARQAINRKIQRKGKLWVRVFPHLPVTKKSSESRMGKGIGSISFWTSKIRGGKVLFEILGIKRGTAIEALKTGKAKLPIKSRIIFF